MTLTSKLSVSLAAELDSPLDLAVASMPLAVGRTIRLTTGTAANQADLVWSDTRTLAASATETLDLAGVLTNPLTGAVITFARVKMIYVSAASDNASAVNVSREATNGAPIFLALGDGVAVRPGGVFALGASDATAYVVTPGTGDLLTITNSGSGTSSPTTS